MRLFEITRQSITQEQVDKLGPPSGTFSIDGRNFHYAVHGSMVTKQMIRGRGGVPATSVFLTDADGVIIAKADLANESSVALITFYSQNRTAYVTNSRGLMGKDVESWSELAKAMGEFVVDHQDTIRKELERRIKRYAYLKGYNARRGAEGKTAGSEFDAFDVN